MADPSSPPPRAPRLGRIPSLRRQIQLLPLKISHDPALGDMASDPNAPAADSPPLSNSFPPPLGLPTRPGHPSQADPLRPAPPLQPPHLHLEFHGRLPLELGRRSATPLSHLTSSPLGRLKLHTPLPFFLLCPPTR